MMTQMCCDYLLQLKAVVLKLLRASESPGGLVKTQIAAHPAAAAAAAAAAKSFQSCPSLCDPMDGSPPGPAVPGVLQARTLESTKK